MTDFKKYHNANSRDDINRFFSIITYESKFYENTQNKQTFSIKCKRLIPALDHLNFLDKERKEYFEIARSVKLHHQICVSYNNKYQNRQSNEYNC